MPVLTFVRIVRTCTLLTVGTMLTIVRMRRISTMLSVVLITWRMLILRAGSNWKNMRFDPDVLAIGTTPRRTLLPGVTIILIVRRNTVK
jgi:hypothetical protein